VGGAQPEAEEGPTDVGVDGEGKKKWAWLWSMTISFLSKNGHPLLQLDSIKSKPVWRQTFN
jgi:hypothetical protein